MAKINFNIEITVANEAALVEMQGRVADMSVVLNNIADEWAEGNAVKFMAGQGREIGGAALDADVYWSPLSEKYRKSKQALGYEDWLMKATGQLESSMTEKEGFFREVQPTYATWGKPLLQEDEDKLLGNINRRPVVFFNRQDRLMIRKEVGNYLQFGDKYKDILFAKGLRAKEAVNEKNIWQMEWEDKL